MIERFARLGKFHFFEAIRDENGDLQSLQGFVHGPWQIAATGLPASKNAFTKAIIEADKARGRRMTSWPSVRTDLRNAGAEVLDQEAVVDGNMVTSRAPDDIPAFNREMINLFAGARGRRQAA